MKKISYYISLFLSFLLLFSSCERESSNGIATYINPPKDTVKFGYRLATLYYTDTDSKETSFDFNLEISNVYAWKSILINYEKSNSIKKYFPIYDIAGNITSLLDEESVGLENIEIAYKLIPPSNVKLVSTLKYYRVNDPFALIFNYDSVNLKSIERRYLVRESGEIGGIIESAFFCSGLDLGSCSDSTSTVEYQYGQFFNNLYHSNELLPFILLLKNPNQTTLLDILPDLPLYFSRHYATSLIRPNSGTFELGLNPNFEPSFFYFKNASFGLTQGYNFSMR